MKKGLILIITVTLTILHRGNAATVFQENFDSYSAGGLVGQGNWGITGTTALPVVSVFSESGPDNAVSLATSGQDVYDGFTSSVAHNDGDSITYAFTLTLSAAQSGGDYFAHLSDPVGTSANFYDRVFAKSTTGGFLMGLAASSGTGATTDYGTGVLAFNTPHQISVTWNFLAGLKNDTFVLSVDGSAYSSTVWSSTTVAEPSNISAFNLRQGSAGSSATVTSLDDIVVTTVPEPTSTIALIGGIGMLIGLRRRGSQIV